MEVKMRILAFTLLFLTSLLQASEYQQPSPELAALVDQPGKMGVRISADNRWFAALIRAPRPNIAMLAKGEYQLAGLSLSQEYHGSSRYKTRYQRVELSELNNGQQQSISPEFGGAFISATFSPDGRYLALVEQTDLGLWLLLHDSDNNKTVRLTDRALNAVLGVEIEWRKHSQSLITKLVSDKLAKPEAGIQSAAPVIHQSTGQKAAQRTYTRLLTNPYQADLFEYLATSELVEISVKGKIRQLGEGALYQSASLSPDGELLLVKQLTRPFSYLVKYTDFPKITQVLSLTTGKTTPIANVPLAETKSADDDSVRLGYRYIEWRKDQANTLYLVKALEPFEVKTSQFSDQLSLWTAPFTGEPQELIKTQWRFSGIDWHSDEFALLREKRYSKRLLRSWRFAPNAPENANIWYQRSYRDRYSDPGQPLKVLNQWGERVIYRDDQSILLMGAGASPQGNRPFLNKVDLKQHTADTQWTSQAPHHERIVRLLDPLKLVAITARQSAGSPENYFLSDLKNNAHHPLTAVADPAPAFNGISKQLITYERKDGVSLSGTLYLPKGYKQSDGPLPVIMWAYPREYKDPKVAGQVNFSPYSYKKISYWGALPFLAKGFAVFDKVAMPIIGVGKQKPNDNFREQLVANAQAAVEVLVEKGIADKERIAIGGHSYGAFMVANLLAHSDLFAAGITRSGAFNRSLTPFGFQSEKRNFWEAQSLYQDMSPFHHADKINEPMLMIHGEADPNSGTFPMQSVRLFNAIKGLGGTARLVLLPHEGHSYKARESLLHMLSEEENWLEQHVKNIPVRRDALAVKG